MMASLSALRFCCHVEALKPRLKRWVTGSLGLAGLLAWGAGHAWLWWQQNKLSTQAYAPPPAGMVFVPAGEFWLGSDDADAEPDERPRRRIFLPAFYMDRLEVTNRRYQELIRMALR